MPMRYSCTPARACHPFPDLDELRAFKRYVLSRQIDDKPVVLTPDEIARATGVSPTNQILIRQTLMLAGVLRLSVVDGAWAYRIEVQS